MEPIGKIRTKAFMQYIEILSKNIPNQQNNKLDLKIIKKYLVDTENLIYHNEWVTGLENLLENIYEINFRIDKKALELAKAAIQECKMDYSKWKFIEELLN